MIYLKKIEVYGFKSFADKLDVKFDQPITGIVGPNGCGKSNVSDAIRWVLGEQRTSMMRGKSMVDLIFNGTDIRSSMSYCEVSLFMDNSTRIFPPDVDELVITRKLYRNGDSEYLINRNSARLKDIEELLRNVGLGRDGYSIVGQGRMDAVLNARPTDRRAIFEEALGISTFRKRKKETENKLERTKINMDNLKTIASELQRQLSPLERQAAAAKKAIDIREKLKHHEVNLYIHNYDNVATNKKGSRDKIAGLNQELLIKQKTFVELNESYDNLLESIANIDQTLTQLRNREVELSVEIANQTGDKKVLAERYNNTLENAERNKQNIEIVKAELVTINNDIAELTNRINDFNAESRTLDKKMLDGNEALVAVKNEVDKVNMQLFETDKATTACSERIAKLNIAITSLTTEADQLQIRLNQVENSQSDLTTRLSSLSGEEGQLVRNIETSRVARNKLNAEIEGLHSLIKEQEVELFERNSKMVAVRQRYASEKGSIDVLTDLANSYKGYLPSISALMNDAKNDRELNSKICGVVANLIKVDDKFVTAIEVALGSRLQNVVTEDSTDAKYIIKHLNKNSLGRVTFLPIASMKRQTLANKQLLSEYGVVGTAQQLVKYDSKYETVFSSLLGSILIVDTYDNAVAIAHRYNSPCRMVTLTGERLSTDGSIEGGSSNKKTSGLLSYDSQLKERKVILDQLSTELAELEETYKAFADSVKGNKDRLAKNNNDLSKLDIDIATLQQKIESSSMFNSADKESIYKLNNERQSIDDRLLVIGTEKGELTNKLRVTNNELEELKQSTARLKFMLTEKNQRKDNCTDSLHNTKFLLGSIRSNIDAIKQSIEDKRNSLLSVEQTLESYEIIDNQNGIALARLKEILDSNDKTAVDEEELVKLKEEIASFDKNKVELNSQFQSVGTAKDSVQAEVERLNITLTTENNTLNNYDKDLLDMQTRIMEEYDVSYTQAMTLKDENFDYDVAVAEIPDLKQALNKLGYVNMNSINDLVETRERYETIASQMEDIAKGDNDLRDVLKNLTGEIQTRFEEGMAKINVNFNEVFKQLFNGGSAKLSYDVEEGKDMLDYGIEIEAQPKGKRLQNISLFSGGERTLIAAAILFAIIKLNPMPFCVLDEIEAALDDSNSERIALYMKKFSKDTQFIVITHKKPTMENCNALYGVTMEESGVSKVVSVKLSEAVTHVQ